MITLLLINLLRRGSGNSCASMDDIIKILTRQCARWLIAAHQDASPMIAVLHAQYGMGYLWAIKDIATTDQFKRATGLHMPEFERRATVIQDIITKKTVAVCPKFAGDIDIYMAKAAGDI